MALYIYNYEREIPTTTNILPSKALVQNQWRNPKHYRQAKAKRIQCHQTSLTTNAKGTSLHGRKKKRSQLETRKSQMGKLTGKGKHKVTVGNQPQTNMISKPATVRRV